MLHKKVHRHLKKKLHPNRWLIWTLALIILSAAAVVSYIEVTNIDFEREVIPFTQTDSWQTYRNHEMGFMLRFPPDWGIETDVNTVIFSNPKTFEEVSVSVSEASQRSQTVTALKLKNRKPTDLGQLPAESYEQEVANNATQTVILAMHNNRLYKTSGFGDMFARIVSSFKYLSNE